MREAERQEKDLERLTLMQRYEEELSMGRGIVLGIDEAGRGPLAGPVTAACVVLSHGTIIPYLNDSKKLTERRREALYEEIILSAAAYGVASVGPQRIDDINILNATFEAMLDAYNTCMDMLGAHTAEDSIVLVDGSLTVPGIRTAQKAVVGGDARCPSIAAASILAKVTRDRLMREYDSIYPEYGFSRHKGYGTREHIEAIRRYGPSSEHRRSFLGRIL